jgi:hypothetical protein
MIRRTITTIKVPIPMYMRVTSSEGVGGTARAAREDVVLDQYPPPGIGNAT